MNPSPENFDPTKAMIDKAYSSENIINNAYKDQELPKFDGEDEKSYQGQINNAAIIKECKLRTPILRDLLREKEKVNDLVEKLNNISKLKEGRFLRSTVVFLSYMIKLLEEGDSASDVMYEMAIRSLDVLNDELIESDISPIKI